MQKYKEDFKFQEHNERWYNYLGVFLHVGLFHLISEEGGGEIYLFCKIMPPHMTHLYIFDPPQKILSSVCSK